MQLPYAVRAVTPTTMPDLLSHELGLIVGRLRGFSPTRYAAPAPPFPSRAAAMWHLAQYLVDATGVEARLPVLPDLALADVVAVTGHDLCSAELSDAGAAAALAEVLLHRYEIDGSLPGRRASALVLGVLGPDVPATANQLLVLARLRCPAYA